MHNRGLGVGREENELHAVNVGSTRFLSPSLVFFSSFAFVVFGKPNPEFWDLQIVYGI
jgi:hypothetical protein